MRPKRAKSRDTFYRYQQSVEGGGVDALINQSRKVPNHKKRVDPGIEKAIIFYAIEYRAHGQVRVSKRRPICVAKARSGKL